MIDSAIGTLLFALKSGNCGDVVVMFELQALFLLQTLCNLLPTVMQDVGAIYVCQTCLFISCIVQGDRWEIYEDGVSFEEECNIVVCGWRKLNRKEESPPKTMFVRNMTLLKKVVLVVRKETEGFAAKANSQPQHCVDVTFKSFCCI